MKAHLLAIATLLLLAVPALGACGGGESPRLSKGGYANALLNAQDANKKRFFSSSNQNCKETIQLNEEFIEDVQEMRIRSAEIKDLHDEWVLTLQEENEEAERWCEFREGYDTWESFEDSLTYDPSDDYSFYWESEEYQPLKEAEENTAAACEALEVELEEEGVCD